MGSATGLTAAGLKGLHAAAGRHVGDDLVALVALVARGGQVHVDGLGRLAVGGPGGPWLDVLHRLDDQAHHRGGDARR
jgi:hypothetical protein